MRLPTLRDWKGESLTAPITSEATPPASSALLLAAIGWPEAVALQTYAGCAHVFDGLTAAGVETRHLGVVVAPGAVHARAAVGLAWDPYPTAPTPPTLSSVEHRIVTTASGGGAVDEIVVPFAQPFFKTSVSFSQTGAVVLSSDTINDTPAVVARKRQIELQTLSAPYVEPMSITDAVSFSVAVSQQIDDLEGL